MGTQFKPYLTGTYKTLSNFPPEPSAKAIINREPIDVWLLNSGSIMLSCSDGATEVELKNISGTTYFASSTFTGSGYFTLLSPVDVSLYTNLSITMINNHATNRIESSSIEWSPNSTNWETDWDVATFSALPAAGGIRSMQIVGNSRKYLRARVISSGTVAAGLSGSAAIYVLTNNG